MLRILNLEAGRVLGQPLDVFGGLFGKSAGAWMQTISDWSDSPAAYQQGDTFAEQIDLENGREGDVLWIISTSGRSPNIRRAVAAALEARRRALLDFVGYGMFRRDGRES